MTTGFPAQESAASFDAILDQARHCEAAGDARGARHAYLIACDIRPGSAEAWFGLAEASAGLGDWQGVVTACSRCLLLSPQDAEAQFLVGEALRAQADTDGAIAAYRSAAAMQPHHAAAHNNAAILLQQKGLADEAIAHWQEAAAARPDDAVLQFNYGGALYSSGMTGEALEAYRKAVHLDPGLGRAQMNLGVLLHETGQLDESERALRAATHAEPMLALAAANLSTVLREQGRSAEAFTTALRAVSLDNHCVLAWSNALVMQAYLGTTESTPHSASLLSALDRVAQSGASARVHRRTLPASGRIRVGYVSADIRDHATHFFLEPLLAQHDRSGFEIFCYDCTRLPDTVSMRIRSLDIQWRDCTSLDDQAMAEQIQQDGIDILVDLMGPTADNRGRMFARHPGAIQASWLGWPGSSGLSAIDYRIVDRHIAEGDAVPSRQYPESLVALPDTWLCYRPPVDARRIADAPILRNDRVVFGSFNGIYKLSDRTLDTWALLISRLPAARLLVAGVPGGIATRILKERLARRGVDLSRVETVEPCSQAAFFELFERVDIALDPFPFNGSTTTLHAMWHGVPVISLEGADHAGRMGVSIMRNLGLESLSGKTESDYIDAACRLAGDSRSLNQLRLSLRERLGTSPLMQEEAFARSMEDAYRGMSGIPA